MIGRRAGTGENAEGFGYTYDQSGNRQDQTLTAGSEGPQPQLSFNGNSQISSGASYDADGDLLAAGSHNLAYGAQNRVISVDNGSTASYVYNALGERAETTVGGVTRDYLFDLAGRPVTTLDTSGNWLRGEVYANGAATATYANGTVYFNRANWLGTIRQRATMTGGPYEACTSLPYGDGLACSGLDPSPLHFTGQPRDSETGLDAFPSRYYSSNLAGWTTPDPSGLAAVNPMNPQSWNPYAYVSDNPMNAIDPLGLNGNGSTGCGAGQPADGPCPLGPAPITFIANVNLCVTCGPGTPPGWVSANLQGVPYCAANPEECMIAGLSQHPAPPGGSGGGGAGGGTGPIRTGKPHGPACAPSGTAPSPEDYAAAGAAVNELEHENPGSVISSRPGKPYGRDHECQ